MALAKAFLGGSAETTAHMQVRSDLRALKKGFLCYFLFPVYEDNRPESSHLHVYALMCGCGRERSGMDF